MVLLADRSLRSRLRQKTGFGRFFIALLTTALSLLAMERAGADEATIAEEEIRGLIAAVETSACSFIRNDSRHDASSAADHLRLKYRRGRRYADTAEHFIERLASKSSWSGDPYYIECDDEMMPSADWLSRELQSLRSATP